MAKVNFIRKHTDVEVNEEPIVDGNFIVTGDGNIYIDYGLERIKIVGGGGGSATGDTLPIGSITAYGKETAPANWLICDGSEVNRTTYSDLFKIIGTKYGEGDGSTTFNLPNLKGRVPVGLDSSDTDFDTIGKIGGEKEVTLTIDKIPEHQHGEYIEYGGIKQPYTLESGGGTSKSGYFLNAKTTVYSGPQVLTEKTGGGQSHNNLQPYEVNNFIIKAFQSAGVVANVVKTKTESDNDVYSCNYVNDNMQKHMLSASFTTDIEPTLQQYVELSNWNAIETVGNKLSIKNGKIVVGTGVSKIKISGILGVRDTTNQLIYIYGRKNGANINTPWVVNTVLDYQSMIYNNLISVKEGDIISIAVYGQKTYNIEYQKSLFIFEVVE